jgi:transcriptional regulator with XRE-family HTH domain
MPRWVVPPLIAAGMIRFYSWWLEVVTADDDVLLSRRRQLAGELRRLREQAGMSGRKLAERAGISQSKVSRIESGATLPTAAEVASWVSAIDASAAETGALKVLTDAAYTEVHPFDDILRGPVHLQRNIRDLENRSGVKLAYQPSVIPGLLQTAEYARRLLTMLRPPYPESDIPAVVAARLDRQTALFDPARKFHFLITEAALRFRLGPATMMVAQLDRIATLSTLDNVQIGLIPADAQAHTYVPHGFAIFEGVDGGPDALVLAETVHAHLTVGADGHVRLYQEHWTLLTQAAVFHDPARDLLMKVSEDMHKLAAQDP